jgi:hypothetical protein
MENGYLSIRLKDEVRDWYWGILEKFSFIRNFITKDEVLENVREIGYRRLLSLLNCKQLAVSHLPRYAYLACNDMVMRYWAPFLPSPIEVEENENEENDDEEKIKKRIRTWFEIEEPEKRIRTELFSLRFSCPLDITMAIGRQPELESTLGIFQIEGIDLFYGTPENELEDELTVRFDWVLTSTETLPISEIAIEFKSPTDYNIYYAPTSLSSLARRRAIERQAIAMLTEVYNNREQITSYINKLYDLMLRLFN